MRLLTYNIHKGIGGKDRAYYLERIEQVLLNEKADIVCLQEVTQRASMSRHDDQPILLAEVLGFFSIYQKNVHYKRGGGYGNLILSRWPIVNAHQISLRLKERKPRGAQLVVVHTPQGPLHVINWHLGLFVKERKWQAEHLLSHRLFKESNKLPTLLVGDTNDWKDRLISGPLNEAGFHEITQPASRFKTFPAWLPVGSLDKLYAQGTIKIDRVHAPKTKLTKQASDHLPVVVDFQIEQ